MSGPTEQTGPVEQGPLRLPELKLDADGLVAAVIQDDATGDVLMVGYMDAEALRRTATEGRVTFWSRSRQEYWRKGDTSGNIQVPRSIAIDCDGDALLVRVDQTGAACHTGARSCFFTPVAMGSVATGSAATDSPATDSAATHSAATGSAATDSAATGEQQ